jgi:DNA-binding XRE family transcriptional regulator
VTAAKPLTYDLRREPQTWGQHLRRERVRRGLRQQDAANEIGVNVFTIHNWELGKRAPEVRYIPVIHGFLRYCPWKAPLGPAERFRMTREALGLTHVRAASILGCDPATLSRWETGERRPPAWVRAWLIGDTARRSG